MQRIDNTPMTGAIWATHHVTVWLENDRLYAQTAKRYARSGLASLRRYVQELVYETPSRVRDLEAVRSSFTRDEFDGIDWKAVRDSLLSD